MTKLSHMKTGLSLELFHYLDQLDQLDQLGQF